MTAGKGLVRLSTVVTVLLATLLVSPEKTLAQPADPASIRDGSVYFLVAGRRLPLLYAISLDEALVPENDGTSNAIVSRSKVALDRLDGRLLGDPANLLVSGDGRRVYVINHHGSIDNAAFTQHGGRGQVAVLDVSAALDARNDRTAAALQRHFDAGGFGAIGAALLDDMIVIANAENHLTEDGGNRVTFVDLATGSLRGTVELALGSPGFACEYPVPHEAPFGPPRDLAVLAPDPGLGCFPNPNGLALGRSNSGGRYAFTANGGTDDVSVIDLSRVLAGDLRAEIGRVPDQRGAWGITATPDGRHVIVASGGSQRDDWVGNTVSIIDVDRAADGPADAEVARVLVGTDDPGEPTQPLMMAVTPDGRELIVANARANNVSVLNLERALAGESPAEVARIPLVREDGEAARPKGVAVTPDGRYAAISGGGATPPFSRETGYVYIIELSSRRVVATVTGVGHAPYALATVRR
jgi:DNA-binding beta-propeller fold protein YncE